MATSTFASGWYDTREQSLVPVMFYSIVFHVVCFIVLPVVMGKVWKPKPFQRPQTFQLVQIRQNIAQVPARPAMKPQPVAEKKKDVPKRPVPRAKDSPRPVPKQEKQEDLSELEDLLGGLPQPVSHISVGKVFPYQWYLNNLQMKVEQNWKPSINDPNVVVILQFSVFASGRISDVTIAKSSGNSALDNLAVRAVKLAEPFGKIPAGWGENRLDLSYTLIPAIR